MDWSKAKNILIIAFIIVNLVLGYTLYQMEETRVEMVSDSFIDDTIEILKEKDISIDTEIPKDMPGMPALSVIYEIRNTEDINKYFFADSGIIENQEDEDLKKIYTEDESVLIENNKIINYRSEKTEKIHKLNENKAIKLAKKFLKDRNYDTNDLRLNNVREENGNYYLEFSKIYKDTYVELAYTNFKIDETGVRSMDRMWLNVEGEGEKPIYLKDAPKSILELLSIDSAEGKTITDISKCYYFNPEDHFEIEDSITARQGKAMPAWRIQFKDGESIVLGND